jgi:hypothetical protein
MRRRSGCKCRTTLLVGNSAKTTAPVDSSLRGFLHIAFLRDLQASPPEEKQHRTAKYLNVGTRFDAKQYMDEVHQKVDPHKNK